MGLGKFSGIAMTLVLSIHSRMSLLPIEHHLRRSFMSSAYAPANYGVILERVERAASCALGADNYEPGLGLDGYLQDFANFVHAVKAGGMWSSAKDRAATIRLGRFTVLLEERTVYYQPSGQQKDRS